MSIEPLAKVGHAIDNKVILDYLLDGLGVDARNIIPPQMPWSIHGLTEGRPFDPEKSRRLLAEAGWTDTDGDGIVDKEGEPFRIEMIVRGDMPGHLPIAEAVQGMLREVGIDMELLVLERGKFFEDMQAGTSHVVMTTMGIAATAGEIVLTFFRRDGWINTPGQAFWLGYEFDDLIDKGLETFDREERYEIYRQIQRVIQDEVITVPLHFMKTVQASGDHVRGFEQHPVVWVQRFDRVYIVGRP